jgi:hypothetical protein
MDMINDFRVGTDRLDLIGYSTGSIAKALATQMSNGHGGSMLLLSDGTRVDFSGLAHLTSSIFT